MRRRGILVRHVHSSSRFDRSPKSLTRALRFYAGRADIITLTEVNTEARAAAMNLRGFAHVRGTGGEGADETGLMYRTKVWELLHIDTHELGRIQRRVGRTVVHALTAVLRHRKSGHVILVSVAHTFAHVEAAGGQFTRAQPDRVNAYQGSLTEWAAHLDALHGLWKPEGTLVTADWNLNLHNEKWRTMLAAHFPPMRWAFRGHVPTEGTHGPRLIDGTLTDLPTRRFKVLPRNRSSDHRPIYEVLVLPAAA